MSKVNTLYNYFNSPKTPKTPTTPTTPKQLNNKKPSDEKSGTPKRTREQRNKAKTPSKGKENKDVKDRKRVFKDDDDDDKEKEKEELKEEEEEEEEEESELIRPKKRRLIIPDEESEDSGDEFKPENESEESDTGSEGCTESESSTASEEETPEKKIKLNKTSGRKRNNTKKIAKEDKKKTKSQQQNQAQGSNNVESWRHLKYDFLQPDKIRDINRRPPTDPEYNPKTLYIPQDFLNQQTPAMRQWWEIKKKHFDCILFFKLGKFYELYHMDAVISVDELNLTYMKGEFAHTGFPEIGYGRFLTSLVERGYKVARIEQTENPEMMAQRYSKMARPTKFDKVVNREICQITTKGTRVYTAQDVEPATANSNYLLSLIEKCPSGSNISHYGVCFLDTTIGDFYLSQFEDDRCNSRLLTLFAHYPPVHVVYERGNLSQRTLKILNNALAASIKEPLLRESQFWSSTTTLKNLHEGEYFKKPDSEFQWPAGLQTYLNQSDCLGLTPADDKELAVHALGGCVHLLKECLLEQQLLAQARFKTYTPPDFSNETSGTLKFANNMVLDAITINNLRIFGEGSLMKTLDRCCTAFGKRLLREWICRPSCRKNIIIERQEAIQELINNSDIVQNARSMLGGLPDLERLLSKIHTQGNAAKMNNHPDGRAIMFERQIYSKKKIVDFTTTLNAFEDVLKIVTLFENFNSTLVSRCTKIEPDGEFPSLRESLDYFKTAFDHEGAKKAGCIVPKRGVDDEYDSVLMELDDIKKDAQAYLKTQEKHFGVKVTYHGSDRKRYQIEIPESRIKKVEIGYELQSQRKNYRRYHTNETKELLSRQINAEEHRDKVLKDLNRRIFAKFSEKYDMWNIAVYKLSVLDVLISLADYAFSGDMCVPEIHDSTDEGVFIDIRDGRHPCILSDTFIPNDTLLGTDNSASFMILTGPNMGGKSTLMRQVALLTIMTQIGSYVPASSCRLTLVDRIFTRLGANDDILAGQSTFLVELSETSAILQHATPYSLVLLDELGRGTSTYDGTAIAASVVNAFLKLNCRTLFSTHYHSLVEDYKSTKEITLAHMACMVETEQDEVSQETVTFLYKLSEGACPKSYGFNAARLAGVPPVITSRAHEISKKLEQETNQKHFFASLCKANGAAIRDLIAAM